MCMDEVGVRAFCNALATLFYDDTVAICDYAEFVAAQKRFLSTERYQKALEWQVRQLEGYPPIIDLPRDFPRSAIQNFDCKVRALKRPPVLANRREILESDGADKDVVIFLAAYAMLLCKLSNSVACPVAYNDLTRFPGNGKKFIGNLSGGVILPIKLDPDDTCESLVRGLEEQLGLVQCERYVPIERLIEEINPQRSLSYAPVAQVAFSYDELAVDIRQEKSAVFEKVDQYQYQNVGSSVYDLTLKVVRSEDGSLQCYFEYSPALFRDDTIDNLSEFYLCLLQAIDERHDESVGAILDIVSEQRAKGVNPRQGRVTEYGRDSHIVEWFDRQVKISPDAIALIDGNQYLSYAALDRRSDTLSMNLRNRCQSDERFVGVYMTRNAEMVASVLAILKSGMAYMPLDPAYPWSLTEQVITDSGVKTVLSDKPMPACSGEILGHLSWRNVNDWSVSVKGSEENIDKDRISSQSPAYLIYTSGSEGTPKGVVGSHRNIINRVAWAQRVLPLEENEICCQKTSLGFVDHVAEIFHPILCGQTLVLASDDISSDPVKLTGIIERFRVSRLTLVPAMLKQLLAVPDYHGFYQLKYLFCSGDSLSYDLVNRFFDGFPYTRLFNIYGSTETGADVTCYEVTTSKYAEVASYFTSEKEDRLGSVANKNQTYITHPNVSIEELKSAFTDTQIPVSPLSMEVYKEKLEKEVFPYVVNVSAGAFIGHMTSALPSFVPEFSRLLANLNQNLVKVETSKSLTLLERQVMGMLHRLFFNSEKYDEIVQNPEHVLGVATSGGSTANILAMQCARNRGLLASGYNKQEISRSGAWRLIEQAGYRSAVIIASPLAHYSVKKAAALLGIGESNIITVAQDEKQKLSSNAVEECVLRCRENGQFIIAMIGVAGATETGTIDPLVEMATIARRYSIHFHVDAAWGGAFIFSDRHRHVLAGIEMADTITFCAHKQLYAPQGLSVCLFRDTQSAHASSVHAEYQGQRGTYDMGQYTLEGSRPPASFFMHVTFNLLSRRGIGWLIDKGMSATQVFKQLIIEHEAFELIGDPEINILNYRYIPIKLRRSGRGSYSLEENDEISEAVESIQKQQFLAGRTFVSRTRIINRNYSAEKISVFRVVLSNPLTKFTDLVAVLNDQLCIAIECVEGNDKSALRLLSVNKFNAEKSDEFERQVIPIGKPIDNAEVYILDQNLRRQPAGIIGQIAVGGDCVSLGYHGRSAALEGKYIDHPSRQGESLFLTGDLGRINHSGEIEFYGRMDQQLKINGCRIEPGEIEAHLRMHAAVSDCAVVGEPRRFREKLLVAFIATHQIIVDQDALKLELRRHLEKVLPQFMIPHKLILIERMPVLSSGKVDRKTLVASLSTIRHEHAQPLGDIERQLAVLWGSVLEITDVSRKDNFFALGGDSLLYLVLLRKLNAVFGLNLTLRQLFENSDLDQQAAIISSALVDKKHNDLKRVE
ncbi:MAG: hypothetical protein Tsb002_08910 [Wenzhouxiangellaceae bacterium]